MATAPPVDEPRTTTSGPQLLAVLGGLVVLLLVLWFVFLRGGGEEEPAATPTPPPAATGEPVPPEEPDGDGGKGPVETFEVFAPKDPFKPLIVASGGGGGVPVDGVPGATDGGNGGDGVTVIDGNGNGNGNGGPRSVGGHSVRVIEVINEEGRAQIQIDGTVFTVDEGEVFADNFQLLSVQGDCATLLFGDDQFTLCEGEEILK